MLKWLSLAIISIYQKTLSPDHGLLRNLFPNGFCRFYPSCSEYTKQAIKKQGFFKGVIRGMWRILRCNPFSKGGFDNLS